jgi:hypothetical protein
LSPSPVFAALSKSNRAIEKKKEKKKAGNFKATQLLIFQVVEQDPLLAACSGNSNDFPR